MAGRPSRVEPRWHQVGQAGICAECGECPATASGKRCGAARGELRTYGGIRLTADGFDCALPVTIDSHSVCAYDCAYCFSENLMGHQEARHKAIGQTPLGQVERIWRGEGGQFGETIRRALRWDKPNAHGFRCPVQLGGINDPGDEIERNQGWFLRFAELMVEHNQPVRVSTKGRVFAEPEYQRAFAKAPHLFWVAFSIISPDDDLLPKVDRLAPPPSQRLATMAAMSKLGCRTSLRFRPMIPGLSDRTPKHRYAYRDLINRAADAGASAVSYEVVFVPMRLAEDRRKRWEKMEATIKVPLKDTYKKFGKTEACLRPSYQWTEDIMHAVAETARANGMAVGVSDPCWKQLNDFGCCCGISRDDPVFGNWEPENATNALVVARDNPGHIIRLDDIIPPWSRTTRMSTMCSMGAGPKVVYECRHKTWANKLFEIWHDTQSQRGPWHYFQGALKPVRLPDGELGYKYVGLKRRYPKSTPYWRVMIDGVESSGYSNPG